MLGTDVIIKISVAAVIGAAAIIARSAVKRKLTNSGKPKWAVIFRAFMLVLIIICGWYFIRVLIKEYVAGHGGLEDAYRLYAPRMTLFDVPIDNFTIVMWFITATVFILSLLFKSFLFPKFSERPSGIQNIFEFAVESIHSFAGIFTFNSEEIAKRKAANAEKPKIKQFFSKLLLVLLVIGVWYIVGLIISIFAGGPGGLDVNFELFPPRTILFGISFSNSTIITWAIIAVVSILSLIFRFILFPKFSEKPKSFQNIIELTVESMYSFTKNTAGDLSDELPAYMFSIAVLLISCAITELFGMRPPTADLIMTFSLGIATFFLINLLSIKKNGIKGRIKGLASPSPIIFPMKIMSDLSIPVSLACRLFGNMLGGLIVMDLLRSALGGYSVGLTALAGLYFNLFHPLIQTYIFIILSLTFINEAAESH